MQKIVQACVVLSAFVVGLLCRDLWGQYGNINKPDLSHFSSMTPSTSLPISTQSSVTKPAVFAMRNDRHSPNKAALALEQLISIATGTDAIKLTEDLANLLTLTRQFQEAATLRQKTLDDRMQNKNLTVAEFVVSTAAIAQDLQHAMKYDKALEVLNRVPLEKLDASSKAILLRMESDIYGW
jgi:hypothetical protein